MCVNVPMPCERHTNLANIGDLTALHLWSIRLRACNYGELLLLQVGGFLGTTFAFLIRERRI